MTTKTLGAITMAALLGGALVGCKGADNGRKQRTVKATIGTFDPNADVELDLHGGGGGERPDDYDIQMAFNQTFGGMDECVTTAKDRKGVKKDAAEAMGINTTRYKITAFLVGAFFAGLAGGMYAHFKQYIAPQGFGFDRSIEIVVMVILGGMGNTGGVILAAVLLTVVGEWLRQFGDPYAQIAYDFEGRTAIDFGVYGAPETFLVDADGVIRYKYVGPMTDAIIAQEIEPRVSGRKP